ncbi:MAG TPA: Xaa-Pro peptidase family protein [Symbiobacteriaceae bacterium]|jgi:Xaa-Pro aminopeptidase
MSFTPKTEVDRRLGLLQQHLAAEGLDGALLHGITNLYYYSGTGQQGHLWVPAAGTPALLVRRVLDRARAESPLQQIVPVTSFKQLPDFLGGARRIAMELDILPVTLFGQYQKALPGMTVTDIGPYTRLARSVKSPWEIEQTRGAAKAADETFQEVRAAIRPGMTELELSALAEAAQRRHGFQGMLRWRAATGFECPHFHVIAGESALAFSFTDTPFGGEGLCPAAPFGPGTRVIGRNMPVCVDYLATSGGYLHDMTRTLSVGPLDAELVRAYGVAREILAMFRAEARPGVTAESIWQKSVVIAVNAGLEQNYMGWGENRVKFLGHGVGLELDELPVLAPRQTQQLAVGNVIAVEPKFFFPGKGAVGLENTYALLDGGVECLTLTAEEIAVV